MRPAAVLASAFAAIALALPQPQVDGIDIDGVEAEGLGAVEGPPLAATVTAAAPTYNDNVAAASAAADPVLSMKRKMAKRATATTATTTTTAAAKTCVSQPKGYGPTSTPDTTAAFLADPQYNAIADAAPIPQGYALAFSNLHGATEGAGYLGYTSLKTYDTIKCQQLCDAADSCYGFNVFMEHDPTVDPGPSCPNPPSTTVYKCSLWGYKITDATATNQGQWREQFQIGIAGSNGYNALAAPPSYENFTGPVELGGAIQAPNGYMGYKYFPGAYNPAQCASSCQATTQYDKRHPRSDGTYDVCAYFNSYVLSKNNVPQGTYCSMYTLTWGKQYSTNYGQYRGEDYYSVSQSYGYTFNVAP